MGAVPHLRSLDSTLGVWREGYEFIRTRSQRLQSDVFRGRLLGRPAVFMTGAAAAELFYDTSRFRRAGALPALVQQTLFGRGGVQGLDGAAHAERKALFMTLMSRGALQHFVELADSHWMEESRRWEGAGRVILFDAARDVLCGAACDWAGVTIDKRRMRRLARDCVAMVDGFASFGPRMLLALAARRRSERWAQRQIRAIRKGELLAPPGTAARVFADHRRASGRRLSARLAAIELLNVIRPITALSWPVSFLAHGLHSSPEHRDRLAGDDAFVESFVQEVRRFYPFTPFLGAKARVAFEWRGVRFRADDLAILDVYGTLRDARLWPRPDEFIPERFLTRQPTPFDHIPNGGGDFWTGHRCAGEWLTIEALKQAARLLARRLSYELPPQRLDYSLARIPTRPASGVVLARVRVRADLERSPASRRSAAPRASGSDMRR